MDIPAFAVTALLRVNCPQPQNNLLWEFLNSQGKICNQCPHFTSGTCQGFNNILLEPLSLVATLDDLHDGHLELVVIFDHLKTEARNLSYKAITMAVTMLSLDGATSPLTGDDLVDYLHQHFTASNGIEIDKKMVCQTIKALGSEIERLLAIPMPSAL